MSLSAKCALKITLFLQFICHTIFWQISRRARAWQIAKLFVLRDKIPLFCFLSFDILCVERFICIIKCPSTTINSNYLDMLTTITLLLLPQHYSSASNNKYNKMLPRKAGGHTTNKKEFVVDYGASDGKLSIPNIL